MFTSVNEDYNDRNGLGLAQLDDLTGPKGDVSLRVGLSGATKRDVRCYVQGRTIRGFGVGLGLGSRVRVCEGKGEDFEYEVRNWGSG